MADQRDPMSFLQGVLMAASPVPAQPRPAAQGPSPAPSQEAAATGSRGRRAQQVRSAPQGPQPEPSRGSRGRREPSQFAPQVSPLAMERAQALSQFFPQLGSAVAYPVQQGVDTVLTGATGILGGAASVLGATTTGAQLLQAAQDRGDRVVARSAARSAAQAPAQTAPNAPNAPAAVRTSSAPAPKPMDPRMIALQNLSGLNMADLERLRGVVPPPPAQMPVKDRIMQTAFDLAMRDAMPGMADDASVEQNQAATQRLMAQLTMLLGNNTPSLMLPSE